MKLAGYRLTTNLDHKELEIRFMHYFGRLGWKTWRWLDYEIGAVGSKDFNWLWIILLLFNLLAVISLFLYWALTGRNKIRIIKGEQTGLYYVDTEGRTASLELVKFAEFINAGLERTWTGSRLTIGEVICYLTVVFIVLFYVVLFLAIL